MTEYESHDDAHHTGADGAAHDGGALDDHVSHHVHDPAEPPAIPEDPALGHAPAPELHFPGDDPPASHAGDDGWADDDEFERWLHEESPPADPATDAQLRAQLTVPDDADGLPPAEELVEWALRQGAS